MRKIRNILAGCLTLAAGLYSQTILADSVMPAAPVDDGVEQAGFLAGDCGPGCVAEPCILNVDCAVPFDCYYDGGCSDYCGYGDNGCAEYGRGGWLQMQKATLKYGWHCEAGTLCGGCHGACGHCGGCGGYFAYKLRCLFGVSGGMTHSPGHGYVLPMRRPIYDVSHPYTYMWSATGIGCGPQVSSSPYRNVYMPTDTTQLGYSYGHVPYWMPRAGMVPAVPVPDAYHNRICVSDRCQGGPCRYSAEPPEMDDTPPDADVEDADDGLPQTAVAPLLNKIPE